MAHNKSNLFCKRHQLLAVGAMLVCTTPLLHAQNERIVIEGGDLAEPVEITSPEINQFHVVSGPGTSSSPPRAPAPQSFIIDWARGLTAAPEGLPVYRVTFHMIKVAPALGVTYRNTYVVYYSVDPDSKEGFVYLPGEGDDEYLNDIHVIWRHIDGRPIEGNWFHAWESWNEFAEPLIAASH